MRILRSIRVRHVLVLLLAYAAWSAFLWWAIPFDVRPRFIFQTSAQEIQDMSPDGQVVALKQTDGTDSNQYWDITTGTRVCDPRWQFHEKSDLVRWRARNFSENGRFFAYGENDGQVISATDFECDCICVQDLQDNQIVARLKGSLTVLAISNDGRTAATRPFHRQVILNQPWDPITIWNLTTSKPIADLAGSERLKDACFYSADGQYAFAVENYREWDGNLCWWSIDGTLIGNVPNSGVLGFSSSMKVLNGSGSSQVFVDGDRILVTYDGGDEFERPPLTRYAKHEFWDVATGKKLGEWRRKDKSEIIRDPNLIGSRDSRYVGVYCEQLPTPTAAGWRKWLTTMKSWFGAPRSSGSGYYVILLDVIEQKDIARVPGYSAQFSRDGRVLVTMQSGVVSVYDLPFRKPWARITGFAAIGALATCGACAGFRRAIRWVL